MADSSISIISILGGSRSGGRWRVPKSTSIFAVLGKTVIDLREAESDAEEITITCMCVLARVTILVPDGADVQPSCAAVLGSATCQVPPSDAVSPLPHLGVEAKVILGRLAIQVQTDEELGIEPKRWFRRRRGRRGDDTGIDAGTAIAAASVGLEPEPAPGPRSDDATAAWALDAADDRPASLAHALPEVPDGVDLDPVPRVDEVGSARRTDADRADIPDESLVD